MYTNYNSTQINILETRNGPAIATIDFTTRTLNKIGEHPLMVNAEIDTIFDGFIIGQVFPWQGRFIVLGRDPGDVCLELDLKAPGNPDHGQFSAVAPSIKVRGTNLEELKASCEAYITHYDLGGGNWGGGCGAVFEVAPGKRRKKFGHFSYNRRFWTVAEDKAEVKRWQESRAKLKAEEAV